MKYLLVVLIAVLNISCDQKDKEKGKESNINKTESLENDSLKQRENIGKSFPFIIKDGQIGTINTGDTLRIALEKLKYFKVVKDSIPACEACQTYSPLYKIFHPESDNLSFTIEPGWQQTDKDLVFRIRTSDERFVTEKGVKVGMTIASIRKQYGIERVHSGGEPGIHILVNEFKGSFGIEKPNDRNWWKLNKETIPDSLKIEEIIIL